MCVQLCGGSKSDGLELVDTPHAPGSNVIDIPLPYFLAQLDVIVRVPSEEPQDGPLNLVVELRRGAVREIVDRLLRCTRQDGGQ